ncbi:MAG: PH domain-containing protein [Planctomycetota bacterium]
MMKFRCSIKKGVIGTRKKEVPIAQVSELGWRQGIMERIVGVASLTFSTSASSGVEIVWRGVASPNKVYRLVRHNLGFEAE